MAPVKRLVLDPFPAFDPIFAPPKMRYRVAYGGRGSGKSRTFCTELILRCCEKPQRVLCTREFQNSIADSVYRLLIDQINRMELQPYFEWTQSEIRHKFNNSRIIFKGLRDADSIKSTEKIDIAFVEEAQTVSKNSWDILIPTIRADDSEIWVVFNPLGEDDPTYQKFVVHPTADMVVRKVNYDQNPFFPEVLRKEMEYLKEIDYSAYLHVWEGECRSMTEASVMRDRWRVAEFEPRQDWEPIYLGMDFGFAADPSALVRCFIREQELFVDYEAVGKHVELDDLPKLMDRVPLSRQWKIYADCSRPETISYLKRQGFNIAPAEKWQGSVEDGLAHLRGFRTILIHPRCENLIYECKNYRYKTDPRTNEVVPILLDRHNHSVDALRYSLDRLIPRRGVNKTFERIGQNRYGQVTPQAFYQ